MVDSEQPHPSISIGAIERFMDSLKNPNLKEAGIFAVTIDWKGKKETRLMGPQDMAYYGDRAEGKQRAFDAAYMVKRDGNGCMGRYSGICAQGEAPFENPTGADFDHVDGDKQNRRLHNIQLMCSPCNSHKQNEERRLKFQRKSGLATASTQVRERTSDGVAEELPEVVRTNRANRPLYERWLADNSPMTVYDAIYAGARYLQGQHGNGSPQACRNYLKTVTAGTGAPFIIEDGRVRKS